jgi:phosphoribosylformylglycinamidine cyclo-ligase
MARPPATKSPPAPAPLTYATSGVDAQGAARSLTGLLASLRRTIPLRGRGQDGEVLLDFGHYANVIRVGDHGIAVSTDGVGSKILVAEMAGKYDTLGIDLVAMNVNDLLCVGAEPLCMLDYIAVRKVDDRMLAEIGVGLEEGAKQAEITIPAGEIAQLPDMIAGAHPDQGLDLVGTALGIVDPERMVLGRAIAAGDVAIGFASTGLHSNGYSLVRRVLLERARMPLDAHVPELGRTLAAELLEPTRIYVRLAMDLLRAGEVHGLAHITGDGLSNLLRLHPKMSYYFPALPDAPPIFALIAARGGIAMTEMVTTFNMGIGLIAVVPASRADAAMTAGARHGIPAFVLGEAVDDGRREIRIDTPRLRVTMEGAS